MVLAILHANFEEPLKTMRNGNRSPECLVGKCSAKENAWLMFVCAIISPFYHMLNFDIDFSCCIIFLGNMYAGYIFCSSCMFVFFSFYR